MRRPGKKAQLPVSKFWGSCSVISVLSGGKHEDGYLLTDADLGGLFPRACLRSAPEELFSRKEQIIVDSGPVGGRRFSLTTK